MRIAALAVLVSFASYAADDTPVVHYTRPATVDVPADTYVVPAPAWARLDTTLRDAQDRDTNQKAQIDHLAKELADRKPPVVQALIWIGAGVVLGAGTVIYFGLKK